MNEANIIDTLLAGFPLIVPEVVLVVAACLVYMGGVFLPDRHLWATVSLLGVAVAGLAVFLGGAPPDDLNIFASPLVSDGLAAFLRWLALGVGVVLILFSWNEVGDRQAGDYYGCLLIVLAGLSLTGQANDLVTLFLALELISIPTYVMLYLPRHDDEAQEAALKYFLLSIFSVAILLFGFSYLYGLTGSTNLTVILATLQAADGARPVLASVALVMILAGLGFKITAVPFHFYAPDVYQGTPSVMAAVLAIVPKAAGFAALLRVLGFVLPPELAADNELARGTLLSGQVPVVLWFLAAITMFIGNFLALLQDNVRRMLAYSSVAHSGYMLVGLAAAPYLTGADGAPDGVEAVLFYLVAYGAMTVGAFAVLAYLDSPERPVRTVDDLAGLSQTHPGIALLMVVFLFSLIGIPFTAGFTGKLLIFFGAVGVTSPAHITLFRVLALLGMINAAIGGWYYLRLIAAMYLRTAVQPARARASVPALAAIALCALLTIGLSVPPGVTWLLGAAENAAGTRVRDVNQQERAEAAVRP